MRKAKSKMRDAKAKVGDKIGGGDTIGVNGAFDDEDEDYSGGGAGGASRGGEAGGYRAGQTQVHLLLEASELVPEPRRVTVAWFGGVEELEEAVRSLLGLGTRVGLRLRDFDFDELVRLTDSDLPALMDGFDPNTGVHGSVQVVAKAGGPAADANAPSEQPAERLEMTLAVSTNNGLSHRLAVSAASLPHLEQQIRDQLNLSTPITLMVFDEDFGEFIAVSSLDDIADAVHVFAADTTEETRGERLANAIQDVPGLADQPAGTGGAAPASSSIPLARMLELRVAANDVVATEHTVKVIASSLAELEQKLRQELILRNGSPIVIAVVGEGGRAEILKSLEELPANGKCRVELWSTNRATEATENAALLDAVAEVTRLQGTALPSGARAALLDAAQQALTALEYRIDPEAAAKKAAAAAAAVTAAAEQEAARQRYEAEQAALAAQAEADAEQARLDKEEEEAFMAEEAAFAQAEAEFQAEAAAKVAEEAATAQAEAQAQAEAATQQAVMQQAAAAQQAAAVAAQQAAAAEQAQAVAQQQALARQQAEQAAAQQHQQQQAQAQAQGEAEARAQAERERAAAQAAADEAAEFAQAEFAAEEAAEAARAAEATRAAEAARVAADQARAADEARAAEAARAAESARAAAASAAASEKAAADKTAADKAAAAAAAAKAKAAAAKPAPVTPVKSAAPAVDEGSLTPAQLARKRALERMAAKKAAAAAAGGGGAAAPGSAASAREAARAKYANQ